MTPRELLLLLGALGASVARGKSGPQRGVTEPEVVDGHRGFT